MKIAIIGAGAMGSLFGGRLALAGEEVWLLDIWQEHVKAIAARGLIIASPTGNLIAVPRATTRPADIGPADLIIICVKSWATRAAARIAVGLLGPNTAVVTLQNGYGNPEEIAACVGVERVIAGTTAQGATLLGPGRIRHAGVGETQIGELGSGNAPRLQAIAATLTRAGIPTIPAADVASLIWGKLLINVGINPLSAITGLRNGELADRAETRDLLAQAVREAAAVAAAAKVALPYSDPVAKTLAVAQATAKNRSSMLQDILNGRATEIDALNGVIVSKGRALDIATPVNYVLTLLVKTLEGSRH